MDDQISRNIAFNIPHDPDPGQISSSMTSSKGSASIDIEEGECVENEVPDRHHELSFSAAPRLRPSMPSRRLSYMTRSLTDESERSGLSNSLRKESWGRCASASDLSYDMSILERIVDDVGRHAYGIIGIEIWMMDENGMTLSQPKGGFWIDNVYWRSHGNNIDLVRLKNISDVEPTYPGQGIAGYLFSESDDGSRRNISFRAMNTAGKSKHPTWRSLRDIVDDEDQPYDERTKTLLRAGFEKALGVSFHHESVKGLVVFYTRDSAREEEIFGPLQQIHLLSGVDMIGSTLWMQNSRRAVTLENRKRAQNARKRFSGALLSVRAAQSFRQGSSQSDEGQSQKKTGKTSNFNFHALAGYFSKDNQNKNAKTNSKNKSNEFSTESRFSKIRIPKAIRTWANKCKGAGKKPPPGKPPNELLFVFFCVLIQLLIVSSLDSFIRSELGEKYGFQRGAFGSNTTNYFSFPAAPASQPRAMILGHTLCCSISIVLRYFIGMIPARYQASLGGALGSTAMAALGVSTPSATGLGASFSYDENLGWIHVGLLLVQNIVMVSTATFLNNWSTKHQFPHSWTFIVWPEKLVAEASRFKRVSLQRIRPLTQNLTSRNSAKVEDLRNETACK